MQGKHRKILLKVNRRGAFEWVHFCYASSDLCEQFFSATGCKPSEFGAYLSVWALEDYDSNLAMTTYEDMQTLTKLVNTRFKSNYAELYALSVDENPKVSGWLRLWVSRHMRVAIVEAQNKRS